MISKLCLHKWSQDSWRAPTSPGIHHEISLISLRETYFIPFRKNHGDPVEVLGTPVFPLQLCGPICIVLASTFPFLCERTSLLTRYFHREHFPSAQGFILLNNHPGPQQRCICTHHFRRQILTFLFSTRSNIWSSAIIGIEKPKMIFLQISWYFCCSSVN